MNTYIKKLTIASIFLLNSAYLTPFAFDFDPYKDLYEQFDSYVSLEQTDKLQLTTLLTTCVLGVQTISYLNDKYPQENTLVVNLHPHAQKWYDEMLQKYPQAHLDQKKFIQAKYSQSPAFYNIYFTYESLHQIDQLYKKQLAHETLTDIEQRVMKQNEFLLLYQAGYIEYNYNFKKNAAITTGFVATESSQVPALKFVQLYPWFEKQVPTASVTTLSPDLQKRLAPIYTEMFNDQVQCFESNYSILSVVEALLFIIWYLPAVEKAFETKALQFACTQCNDDCLQPALVLYEKHNKSSLVQAIKDEIKHRNKA